jgi:hypothetical protein
MLAGDEVKPTPSSLSIPAALSASSSSMRVAASNTNNSRRTSTGRHCLSQRQLVLLREMLNSANATVDVTPEDVAEEEGGCTEQYGYATVGWRKPGKMGGMWSVLRALKQCAAVRPSPPPVVLIASLYG